MLEFNTNTLAFMTAALEQACKRLKNDTPAGRQFIASKIKECARSGQVSLAALTEAAEDAVAKLNGEKKSARRPGFLNQLFRSRPTRTSR
jgi:ketopantoate reductase